jgi:hypothetical protein
VVSLSDSGVDGRSGGLARPRALVAQSRAAPTRLIAPAAVNATLRLIAAAASGANALARVIGTVMAAAIVG